MNLSMTEIKGSASVKDKIITMKRLLWGIRGRVTEGSRGPKKHSQMKALLIPGPSVQVPISIDLLAAGASLVAQW